MFFAIVSALFFAIRFPIVKKATITGDAIDAVAVTLAIDASAFLSLALLLNYPNFGITRSSFFAFFISGFLGSFLGLLCLYKGIERIGGSIVAPMARGSLLISILIAVFVLGESVTVSHIIGIILLFFGVISVSYEIGSGNSNFSSKELINFLYPVGAMFLFGLISPLVKFGYSEGTPITVGLGIMFTASFGSLVLFLFYRGQNLFHSFCTPERKLYLAAGGVHCVAMGFFNLSISVSLVTIAMPFRSMSPIFVLMLSYFFLRKLEKITTWVILGTAFTVIGGTLIGISI